MPYKALPANPSLDHLKYQARDLQKSLHANDPRAMQRMREFHPQFLGWDDSKIVGASLRLSDFQLVIAREYCFASWAKLKLAVEAGGPNEADRPLIDRIADPVFRRAVEILDSGDVRSLRDHLAENPLLVSQRVFFSISDYFGQPTLLEFIAENPIRNASLPSTIVECARVILDSGARNDRAAVNRALGLVASGLVVRKCGVQIALIDLLCAFGGEPNSAMASAVAHGEFEAVEALLRNGADLTLAVAIVTQRVDVVLGLIESATSNERHIGLALASQFGHLEILRALLESGEDPNRFNPVGFHSHSTPLHQAALSGHLAAVKLLVEHGADVSMKDIMFGGTPLGWAEHGKQDAVVQFLEGL